VERREIERGNRRKGEARQDFQTLHGITLYDLELISEHPLEENVTRLNQAWTERRRPSALDRMLEGMKAQK
jgi:chloramphenicol 3-O phosphotransferase